MAKSANLSMEILNAEIHEERNLLHKSASEGWTSNVNILLTTGADINAVDENKRTPLHCSAKNGHTDVVKILLNYGADINAEDYSKKTPLHYSVESCHKDVVEIFCKAGANINAADDTKSTPLHCAASNGSVEIVVTLLTTNASDNVADDSDNVADDSDNVADDKETTPLHDADFLGNKETTASLLDADANISAEDDTRRIPQDVAAHKVIQQGSSSAECLTLPSSGMIVNSGTVISSDTEATTSDPPKDLSLHKCEDISDNIEETTSVLPLGLRLQDCDHFTRRFVDYVAKFRLPEQESHKGQCSTDVTSVTNNGNTVINVIPVNIKFRNKVVQYNPQESTQITNAEHVTVNNNAHFSGTEPANSDVDTHSSDSKDSSLDDVYEVPA